MPEGNGLKSKHSMDASTDTFTWSIEKAENSWNAAIKLSLFESAAVEKQMTSANAVEHVTVNMFLHIFLYITSITFHDFILCIWNHTMHENFKSHAYR